MFLELSKEKTGRGRGLPRSLLLGAQVGPEWKGPQDHGGAVQVSWDSNRVVVISAWGGGLCLRVL